MGSSEVALTARTSLQNLIASVAHFSRRRLSPESSHPVSINGPVRREAERSMMTSDAGCEERYSRAASNELMAVAL